MGVSDQPGETMNQQLNAQAMQSLNEADKLTAKAKFYFDHDLLEKSLGFYREALEKREAALGEEEAGVADLHYHLALVNMELERFDRAHEHYDRATAIYEKLYYPEHFALGPVASSEATCFLREGKLEDAEKACLKAHGIFGKTLSGEHRLALEAAYKLATIQRALGKGADALKLFQRVMKAVDTPLGPLEEFKFLEALIQEDQGAAEPTEKAYKEAIDLFARRRNLSRLAACLEKYGEFLKKQGRDREAEPVLKQAESFKEQGRGLSRSQDIFPSTLLRA